MCTSGQVSGRGEPESSIPTTLKSDCVAVIRGPVHGGQEVSQTQNSVSGHLVMTLLLQVFCEVSSWNGCFHGQTVWGSVKI